MAARIRTPTVIEPDPNGAEAAGTEPDAGDIEAIAQVGEDWSWYVYRQLTADEVRVMKQPRALVARLFGPVDIVAFQNEHGGGTFEFWGTIKGQRGLADRFVVPLAGTIRPINPPAAPAAVPLAPSTPPAASPLESALLHQLERMSDRLDRLERAPVAPPAPPATMKDLAETMVLLDGLHRGRSGPADPNQEVVATMMEQWRQGYETGQMVGGGNESSQWVEAAKVIAPVFSRVMDRVAARRAGAPPAAGTPPGPSSAEVVEEGRPAPPPLDELATARMMTAVDALARAFSRQLEAEAFADSLRDILTDTELGVLVSIPPEAAVAMLIDRSGPHRELLSTDAAKAYTVAVLRSLNSPPETESPTP